MYLIHKAHVVNEGRVYKASVSIKDDKIDAIFRDEVPQNILDKSTVIDGEDCWLMPGMIDDHVHFRDPGYPDKGDFASESRAAVAGGVTSVLDMPNTQPQTTTMAAVEQKIQLAAQKSCCNYGFYIGATADNQDELNHADYTKVCGVKLFLGSSTGGMLVNDPARLKRLFAETPALIAAHAEDNAVIEQNLAKCKEEYGSLVPVACHSRIRSAEACFVASSMLVNLARSTNARLHLMHLSTEKELALLEDKPLAEKRITAEACPHYLWFSNEDYERLGARIKCNPSVKSASDRAALRAALATQRLDVIGTDHAPHALADKQGTCLEAASGMPGVQFALPVMLELVKQGVLSIEQLVEKTSHNPARLFGVVKRGFIRKGYAADLVLVHRKNPWTLNAADIQSKCGWSPYEGQNFTTKVLYTFVNGQIAYSPEGVTDGVRGQALSFQR